jgi:uncharacterized protein HemY
MNGGIEQFGKILLITGLFIACIGVILMLSGKVSWIGRLPGDIVVKKKNFTLYFPLATSIILSIILSLILYFLNRR